MPETHQFMQLLPQLEFRIRNEFVHRPRRLCPICYEPQDTQTTIAGQGENAGLASNS